MQIIGNDGAIGVQAQQRETPRPAANGMLRRSAALARTRPQPSGAATGLHRCARIHRGPTAFARGCLRSHCSSSQRAVEAHEVAKSLGVGIPRMLHESRKAGGQDVRQRLFARRVEGAGQQQRAGIVVDAIAVASDRAPNARHAETGRYRRTSTGNGRSACRAPQRCAVPARPCRSGAKDLEPVTLPRGLEDGHITLGGALPCHRAADRVGALAHRLPARVVGEQLRDFVPGRRRIAERAPERRAHRPAVRCACQYGVETTGLPSPKL